MTKFNKKPKTHTRNEKSLFHFANDVAMEFMNTFFESDTPPGRRRTWRNFPEFEEGLASSWLCTELFTYTTITKCNLPRRSLLMIFDSKLSKCWISQNIFFGIRQHAHVLVLVLQHEISIFVITMTILIRNQ